MDYISRSIESLAAQAGKTFKAVLLTGARQTGKSTLLKHICPDYAYTTLDDDFVMDAANENPRFFLDLHPAPVVIDEIQKAPGLFPLVKIRCDEENVPGLFYLSGSQPLHLMKNVSESLAGRVCILELSTLSLREIMGDPFGKPFIPTPEYIRERAQTAASPKNLWNIIHRGGYPAVQDPEMDWNLFYSSYVSTYIQKDVRDLSAVQNLSDFRKFMVACAARTGDILNISNIAEEIGRDAGTIRNWISILEASGIIYLLEPFSHTVLKRAVKTPKLYFRDTGLAAYLTRWLSEDQLASGAMAGKFFETFVVSEILKSFANAGIDYRCCVSYYRGKDKKKVREGDIERSVESEIDLIIEENGVLYPIEIKKNETVRAEQTSAFTVLDGLEGKKRGTGAVICNCPTPAVLRENVFALPVWYV